MDRSNRVLLIEHLDATGAAASDARPHAAAWRAAGSDVEAVVLEGDAGGELLFPSGDRFAGPGFDVIAPGQLAARVRASRGARVVWAGATPGGGAAARALPAGTPALWWPTGHAPATAAAGPLPALDPALAPVAGSLLLPDEAARRRLSLWDGPFALVPALPATRAAAAMVEAFSLAVEGGVEADLVVLAHPDPGLESLARRAGVAQRVHFVGRAPREAEHAWLATAMVALLAGDAPLSGGLLLRALAAGCPLLAVGEAAAPFAGWLDRHGLGLPAGSGGLAAALAAALGRGPAVQAVRERGRVAAQAHTSDALAGRLGPALRAYDARAARAA